MEAGFTESLYAIFKKKVLAEKVGLGGDVSTGSFVGGYG
jgi:hypothetical protein